MLAIGPFRINPTEWAKETFLLVLSPFLGPTAAPVGLAAAIVLVVYRFQQWPRNPLRSVCPPDGLGRLAVAISIAAIFVMWMAIPIQDLLYATGQFGESPRNRWISWHNYTSDSGEQTLLVEYSVKHMPVASFATTVEVVGNPDDARLLLAQPGIKEFRDGIPLYAKLTSEEFGTRVRWDAPLLKVATDWVSITPWESVYVLLTGSDVRFVAASFGSKFEHAPGGIRHRDVGFWEYPSFARGLFTVVLTALVGHILLHAYPVAYNHH